MFLKMVHLDWESSTLTTRPLLFRHGQVNQTFYTDIIIQMQYTLQKLVLGQVFDLDDCFE